MSIRVTITGTGVGVCALTQKEGDGITVAFENEQPTFLSWKSFKQLAMMRAAQTKPEAKPATTTPPKVPTAQPIGNGNS